MKPVFATDLTENKHNTEPNGREFLTQEPSDALRRRHEEMLDRMNETMEKSQLAKPLRVVEYICSLGWLITLCGILRAVLKADHPTAQLRLAYRNAPGVFWAFGVCLLVCAFSAAERAGRCWRRRRASACLRGRRTPCPQFLTSWTCRMTRRRWTC